MTDRELSARGQRLYRLTQEPGYADLLAEVQERQKDVFEKWMNYSTEKLTGKVIQQLKADFKAWGSIPEWFEEQIRAGQQADEAERKKK